MRVTEGSEIKHLGKERSESPETSMEQTVGREKEKQRLAVLHHNLKVKST